MFDVGGKLHSVSSPKPLTDLNGTVTVSLAKDGRATLSINKKVLANGQTGLVTSMPLDGLQVGSDLLGEVGDYTAPFALEGSVEQAEVNIEK